MTAHHAPGSVVRTCRALGNLVAIAGILLLVWFTLGVFAAQASTTAGKATMTFALWGESSFAAYSAPIGQMLVGIGLLIFGALMAKVGPKLKRSEHGIPMFAAPWNSGKLRRQVAEAQAATAYPERRIGRRMIGLGIPAVLLSALMVWLYPAVTAEIKDEGADIAFGASFALACGLLAAIASVVAVIAGVVFVARAPSEAASMDAAVAERAALTGAVPSTGAVPPTPPAPPMSVPTPPMPGSEIPAPPPP